METNNDIIMANVLQVRFDIALLISRVTLGIVFLSRRAKTIWLVNHCWLKRGDLKKMLQENQLTKNCLIPDDGEKISLT